MVTGPTFALKPKRNAEFTIIVFMVFFVVFWGAPGRRQLARKWFLRGIGNTNNIQGSSLNEIFKILYKMCPLPKPTLLVYQNSRPVCMLRVSTRKGPAGEIAPFNVALAPRRCQLARKWMLCVAGNANTAQGSCSCSSRGHVYKPSGWLMRFVSIVLHRS